MRFSILITTKNRKNDLAFTLNKINYLIDNIEVECVVYDDGSTDGTYDFVVEYFPNIKVKKNKVTKGYIFCRNKMLNETHAKFAVSLDDDAHIVTNNPLESIQKYFDKNTKCGLIGLRIFWGLQEPSKIESDEVAVQVQGFVGCAHVWRMKAWREIPNYPEWFIFYGEENYASYQLFKKQWQVHYLPEVLVNHRVDVKSRKKNSDYISRLRRSLSTGWYLFFLFLPLSFIPRKILYSIWIQLRKKVFKGDIKALGALFLAIFDLFLAMPKIVKNRNRLSKEELSSYQQLNPAKIYWKPKA
ncbi:glycosyltransferase [Flavobacterium ovatum]|uniref:glycosyltransferase n=1 Tax=Flavobacterium ovatum TaxID=1928857 RepID=UPI00344B9DD3